MKGKYLKLILVGILPISQVPAQSSGAEALLSKLDRVGAGSARTCPPKFSGNKVPIIIQAETNHDLSAEERRKEFEGAGRGEYFLGFEGYVLDSEKNPSFFKKKYGCNPATSRANGLSNPYINSVLERFGDHLRLVWSIKGSPGLSDQKPDLHKYTLFLEISKNSITRNAWQSIDKSDLTPGLVKAIDEIVATRVDEAKQDAKFSALQDSSMWNNNEEILKISKRLSYAVIENAEQKENQAKYKTPDMDIARQLIRQPEDAEIRAEFLKTVDLAWRREGFAQSTIELYNRAKAEGKPLHIIVGSSHVRDDINGDSFAKVLKDKGYDVAINVNYGRN